jgi:hypothetical protein
MTSADVWNAGSTQFALYCDIFPEVSPPGTLPVPTLYVIVDKAVHEKENSFLAEPRIDVSL